MIKPNSKLAKTLHFIHRQIRLKWDCFVVITGGEGTGKSIGMFLNIIDYWYKCILDKPIPGYAWNIDTGDFVMGLKKGERYDICGLDEASDELDTSKRYEQFNQFLYLVYNIIRGKGYMTLMVLPSFFDLAPRFRNRRVRFVFDVYERKNNKCKHCTEDVGDENIPFEFTEQACPLCGSTDYEPGYIKWRLFGRKELNLILEKVKKQALPSLGNTGVQPIAQGKAFAYDGELLEEYLKEKDNKMDQTIHKLVMLSKDLKRDDSEIGRCPKCGSKEVRYAKKSKKQTCRKCGHEWKPSKNGGGRSIE